MFVNIMMFIMLYPMMLIVYVVMLYSARPKNGIAFGATVKSEWLNQDGVKEITDRFHYEMKRNLIVLAATPLTCFLTSHISIQLSIWMMWMLIVIAAMEIPYVRANKKIRELKVKMGWYENKAREVYVEIKSVGAVRRVRFCQFAAPIFISAAAALSGYISIAAFGKSMEVSKIQEIRSFGIIIFVLALMTLALYLMAVWMDRQKTDVVSTDSDVNINYARAKKNVWKNFWLTAAWLNTIYVAAVAYLLLTDASFASGFLWGAIVYCALTMVLIFPFIKSMNRIERAYEEKKDIAGELVDERNWIWGTLYYNPKDRHVMVNKRVGIGTTVNMATPVGKGVMIFSGLALLSIPVVCIWLILLEFTPISLKISDGCIRAEHLSVDYEIPISEVENLNLIEEHPRWTKLKGTGMDNLNKGTFNVSGIGKCELFLNPQNNLFLQFNADGKTYYMSGADDEETMEIYRLLTE